MTRSHWPEGRLRLPGEHTRLDMMHAIYWLVFLVSLGVAAMCISGGRL